MIPLASSNFVSNTIH